MKGIKEKKNGDQSTTSNAYITYKNPNPIDILLCIE